MNFFNISDKRSVQLERRSSIVLTKDREHCSHVVVVHALHPAEPRTPEWVGQRTSILNIISHTIFSHSLPSLILFLLCTMCVISLVFHKKRLLWKLKVCMNGQRRRQRTAKKHYLSECHFGLSGCKVDHQDLFRPWNKPYPSRHPPLSIFLCCRISITPPNRLSVSFKLQLYCKCNNYINKMRFCVLFLFVYFCLYLHLFYDFGL